MRISHVVMSGGNIFACNSGFYLSTDYGATWQTYKDVPHNLYALTINPLGYIYAALGQDGIVMSTDQGSTWNQLNTGIPTEDYVLKISAAPNGYLYASASIYGLYRSTDNGFTWEKVSTIPGIYNIKIDGSNIYASGDDGMLKSTDNGATFTLINNGLVATSIQMAATNSNTIYAGTYNGLYYSTNSGTDWLKSGIVAFEFYNVLPVKGKKALLSTSEGLFLLNNSNWKKIDNIALVDMAVFGNKIYGTNSYQIIESKLNANKWVPTNFDNSYSEFIHTIAVNDKGYIFAGLEHEGCYRSTDDGNTWTYMKLPFDHEFLANVYDICININGDIFAGTINGIFRSTDDGNSWTHLSLNSNSYVYSIVFNSDGVIFAGTSEGVYYSPDNGNNWSQINKGLVLTDIQKLAITADGYVYAGTQGAGVFRTTTSTLTKPNISENVNTPSKYVLEQNYPNPFNPSTNISFSIPEQQMITLKVYNTIGEEVAVLVNEIKEPGIYKLKLNSSAYGLPGGVYFYRLNANGQAFVKKMILLK